MTHPCLRCGACCASYLVAMYWREAEALGIDPALTEKLDRMRVSMRMDPIDPSRCIALAGTVGTEAHCRIYRQRPGACREVEASWEHGRVSDQCDRARLRHGMSPLTPADWVPLLRADVHDLAAANTLVDNVTIPGISVPPLAAPELH